MKTVDGVVQRICVKCANLWRPFMQRESDNSTEWAKAW